MQEHDVRVRLTLGGMVVKHEEDAGDGQDQKEVERESAHAPGEPEADGVPVDLGRMQGWVNLGTNHWF